MNVYAKLLLVLFVVCPVLLIPSVVLLALHWSELPYSIFTVRALPRKPNLYSELFRWSIFSVSVIFLFSFTMLIYKVVLDLIRSPANYSKLYSVKRFFLLAVFIALVHGFGAIFLFQSTLTLGNLNSTLKGVLITNIEKILLMMFLISITISFVKYLMAVIVNSRYEKHLKKRMDQSQRHCILLANLVKSCNSILKRRRSRTSISIHEKREEFDDVKEAVLYLEKKDSDRIARIIYGALLQKNETELKESDLKVCFPGNEVSEAFSMLKSSTKEQREGEEGVTEEVIKKSVDKVIEEHKNLDENQKSFNSLSRKLEVFFLIFFLMVTILISLFLVTREGATFGWQLLALITSLSYMTEDTLSRMVKCLIFAFINNPFDIGDQVMFDGKKWTILKIEFFAMQALAEDTKYITDIPISNVSGSKIVNLSRSEKITS